MFPIILKIGSFSIHSYGLLIAAGLFFSMQYMLSASKARGIEDDLIYDITLYAVIAGFLGARFTYVILNFGFYASHPEKILQIWEGGLVFYGGFVAGALAVIVYSRIKRLDLWILADIIAPALALAQFFGRLGCFFAGCCYGKESSLPWAVKFSNHDALAPLGIGLHPTQIYEALGNLGIFFALKYFNSKEHKSGIILGYYAVSYAALRFLVEFLRGDDRGGLIFSLSPSQATAIIVLFVGLAVICRVRKT